MHYVFANWVGIEKVCASLTCKRSPSRVGSIIAGAYRFVVSPAHDMNML